LGTDVRGFVAAFITVRRCSYWSVVAKISRRCRRVAWFADERALGVAEGFLGGFGAVGVDGLGPALGQPGNEVGIGGSRGGGEIVFNPVQDILSGVMPDPVQRSGDDRPGVGGHHGR
jgi:hypothetical protein